MELVVAAIIEDGEGFEVLLSKRENPNYPSTDGKWEFPGGRIKEGEQPEEALKREIQEELGKGIEIERLVHAQVNSYPYGKFLVLYYLCGLSKGGTSNKRIISVRWIPASLVDTLDVLPGTKEAIAKI